MHTLLENINNRTHTLSLQSSPSQACALKGNLDM